ncbi:MAG: DUF448 domain-containing protein [Candidatus Lernaella stagnicola]|nr:DUF448 domain-containing protein [Candidatus Lernaella stagnicola]
MACGKRRPQRELIRLHRRPDGILAVSDDGPRTGRGAYCCTSEPCRGRTIAKKLFVRSLKRRASIADPAELAAEMKRVAAIKIEGNGVEYDG